MKTQKQLKEEYKQKKFRMGVFQIKNTVNGKIYLGSSLNLDAIWNRNRTELAFNGHRNSRLQQEWNEFGEAAFVFEILSELEQTDERPIDYAKEVKELETLYMDELQPFGENGYHNIKL